MPSNAVEVRDDAMELLINDHCREAGVRNLKNQLEKVYRKVAFKLAQQGLAAPQQVRGGDAAGAGGITEGEGGRGGEVFISLSDR